MSGVIQKDKRQTDWFLLLRKVSKGKLKNIWNVPLPPLLCEKVRNSNRYIDKLCSLQCTLNYWSGFEVRASIEDCVKSANKSWKIKLFMGQMFDARAQRMHHICTIVSCTVQSTKPEKRLKPRGRETICTCTSSGDGKYWFDEKIRVCEFTYISMAPRIWSLREVMARRVGVLVEFIHFKSIWRGGVCLMGPWDHVL